MTGTSYRLAPAVIVRSFEHETVLLDRSTLQLYSVSVAAFRQLEKRLSLDGGDQSLGGVDQGRVDDVSRLAHTLLSKGILVEASPIGNPTQHDYTHRLPSHQWDGMRRRRRLANRDWRQ